MKHYYKPSGLARRIGCLLALLGPVLGAWTQPVMAGKPGPDQVLLVVNTSSPVAREIAADYAAKRHIKNILNVQCQDSALSTENESITLADFIPAIQNPLRGYLAAHTNINFIVLTKGIPIRITGAPLGSCDEHSRVPENIRGRP